ncbi:hypothetical protein SLEP1_g56170 [Rubroshorea leprosula]|uniref:Steroid 5-alpha reductase C-terminal domain-containing protein n=1 Tax=Rubroshorea leprosula TaxID=152421 RepID=A0AAV5MHS6_9ROSI|nr:hypothetical protein SLEP1_g56170 [Rubroshorea leprosula]
MSSSGSSAISNPATGFVLDCDPGFAGSLLCNAPSGAVQLVEIHDSDTADMGVCLALYAVHVVDKPLNISDFVAAAVCLCGIVIAYFADTQLHDFVARNQKLNELGKPLAANLERGLWQYSRHPNYFGEQLWWWGLVLFAWNLGHGWTFIGSLINSMCLVYVTVLVEERMLKQDYRAEACKLYQKTTSAWIPWFKSSAIAVKNKST